MKRIFLFIVTNLAVLALLALVIFIIEGVFGVRLLEYQVALTFDYSVPWGLVAISTVLGIIVAVSATHYPRRVAKRIPIIEALRFE